MGREPGAEIEQGVENNSSALILTHIHPICDDLHESVQEILKQSQMYESFPLDSYPIPEVRKGGHHDLKDLPFP